jgi:hypothetical protein
MNVHTSFTRVIAFTDHFRNRRGMGVEGEEDKKEKSGG